MAKFHAGPATRHAEAVPWYLPWRRPEASSTSRIRPSGHNEVLGFANAWRGRSLAPGPSNLKDCPMAAQARSLINVRVDADTAAAIGHRVKTDGGTVSDVVRNLIDSGLGKDLTRHETTLDTRHRAEALAQLSELAKVLRLLGNAYVYGLKSRRPIDEAEDRARLRALQGVEAAVSRIVR